ETFFQQPKLFDSYIALSPSLWWNDMFLARSAKVSLQTLHARRDLSLYIASSGDDGLDEAAGGLLHAAL
ncbi:MAG: alpha/beta hydrolase, partial [Rhodanobacter sp.]